MFGSLKHFDAFLQSSQRLHYAIGAGGGGDRGDRGGDRGDRGDGGDGSCIALHTISDILSNVFRHVSLLRRCDTCCAIVLQAKSLATQLPPGQRIL